MNYLAQVQKGIDFIETNLESNFTLLQVAREASLSQWHFQRIFKALSGETLKVYIRSRRLANALNKLLTSDNKIIDIAVTAGFESQESFTRAFKKIFYVTPNEARKIGNKNRFLKKIEFSAEYLKHINKNISLKPKIYKQKALLFVGIKTQFYSVDSEKNNIAQKLPLLWNEFLPRMKEIKDRVPDVAYGVIQQTDNGADLLEYHAVCEVTHLGFLPEGMVNLEVPASRYAKFTHTGNVKNIDNTVNYIYSSWLMQSGERHSYGADLEIYGSEYNPVSRNSVLYYAIPIE